MRTRLPPRRLRRRRSGFPFAPTAQSAALLAGDRVSPQPPPEPPGSPPFLCGTGLGGALWGETFRRKHGRKRGCSSPLGSSLTRSPFGFRPTGPRHKDGAPYPPPGHGRPSRGCGRRPSGPVAPRNRPRPPLRSGSPPSGNGLRPLDRGRVGGRLVALRTPPAPPPPTRDRCRPHTIAPYSTDHPGTPGSVASRPLLVCVRPLSRSRCANGQPSRSLGPPSGAPTAGKAPLRALLPLPSAFTLPPGRRRPPASRQTACTVQAVKTLASALTHLGRHRPRRACAGPWLQHRPNACFHLFRTGVFPRSERGQFTRFPALFKRWTCLPRALGL